MRSQSLREVAGLRKDWVVVSVDGRSTERVDARGAAQMIHSAIDRASTEEEESDTIELVFRDPDAFRDQLCDLSGFSGGRRSAK